MTDTPDLEARVASLERDVAYLMEIDEAVAAWLDFRRFSDVAYRDIHRIQDDYGTGRRGVEAFLDRHQARDDGDAS